MLYSSCDGSSDQLFTLPRIWIEGNQVGLLSTLLWPKSNLIKSHGLDDVKSPVNLVNLPSHRHESSWIQRAGWLQHLMNIICNVMRSEDAMALYARLGASIWSGGKTARVLQRQLINRSNVNPGFQYIVI
jgi:hypothetical protein